MPGLDIEIFARRDGLSVLTTKLAQSLGRDDENLHLLVMRPDGWGEAKLPMWPAILPLIDATALLHAANYHQQQQP